MSIIEQNNSKWSLNRTRNILKKYIYQEASKALTISQDKSIA